MYDETKFEKEKDLDLELIYVTDKNNLITYMNETMINTLAHDQEQVLYKSADHLYDEEVPKIAILEKKKNITNHKVWHGAMKLVKNGKNNIWLEEYTRPIYENSRVVGYQTNLKPLKTSEIRKATKIYREINQKKSIFFIWENFYYRSILYLMCFISISVLSLYEKSYTFTYITIPALIYYCEVIKSKTFFETRVGSFKDVTSYIFNKNL